MPDSGTETNPAKQSNQIQPDFGIVLIKLFAEISLVEFVLVWLCLFAGFSSGLFHYSFSSAVFDPIQAKFGFGINLQPERTGLNGSIKLILQFQFN